MEVEVRLDLEHSSMACSMAVGVLSGGFIDCPTTLALRPRSFESSPVYKMSQLCFLTQSPNSSLSHSRSGRIVAALRWKLKDGTILWQACVYPTFLC